MPVILFILFVALFVALASTGVVIGYWSIRDMVLYGPNFANVLWTVLALGLVGVMGRASSD